MDEFVGYNALAESVSMDHVTWSVGSRRVESSRVAGKGSKSNKVKVREDLRSWPARLRFVGASTSVPRGARGPCAPAVVHRQLR